MILMRNGYLIKQDIHVMVCLNKGWMCLILKKIINLQKSSWDEVIPILVEKLKKKFLQMKLAVTSEIWLI